MSSTPDTVSEVRNHELTDRTDDFDFVVRSGYAQDDLDWERFGFEALDGKERTDVWFPNDDERGPVDPWDPDTDDDGLTDGQESLGITEIADFRRGPAPMGDADNPYLTSPVDADTDGDGWWDGWIGVYDVVRSDNVILYNEHLHDDDDGDGDTTDDGVQGSEIVQEQVQYHNVSAAPSAGGVDIDGDGNLEHSNIHLGELYWGTDTWDDGEGPQPSMSIEVDYYNQSDPALDASSWRDMLEDNYGLYGIDVTVHRNETLDRDDLVDPSWVRDLTLPFSREDLLAIEDEYHDTGADEYLFVATEGGGEISAGQSGVYRTQPDPANGRLIAVFTDGHSSEVGDVPSGLGLNSTETMQVATAKTAVHEIGHILDLGEADDVKRGSFFPDGEVYSGESGDDTTETVINTTSGATEDDWSVMSSGVQDENFIPPTNGEYTAFSIEEWLTIHHWRLY